MAIIADANMHLGPELALILAKRNHNLVLMQPRSGLVDELRKIGAKVIVVEDIKSINDKGAVQKLVDAANNQFGGFDAAFIRPGIHLMGNILESTEEDFQKAYQGNMVSVFFALQALLPDLIGKKRQGQILIETSATASRPLPIGVAYSSTRAGANMIIRNAAYTVARYGITVNVMGTNFLNYPGFRKVAGTDNPKVLEKIKTFIPIGRLGEPVEAANLAAAVLDGTNMFTTGQVLSVSGGWVGQ